jgi:hypothetical protein
MRVTFNGVDLGGTLDKVSIKTEYGKSELMVDQYGKTVVDRRVSSIKITVDTSLAEVVNKSNVQVVFPNSRLATSGGSNLNFFQMSIAETDLQKAGPLNLHPLSLPNTDRSQDFNFFKAVAAAVSEFPYGPEEQTRLKVTWNVLPDTSVTPPRFFTYGDPNIGLSAATGGSSGYAGTGNGSISGITVFGGYTKTEIITATCVTAVPSGGVFNVSGSQSGPLGLAYVGLPFNAAPINVIAFQIVTGSVSFVVNDVFTLTTQAANYV